MGLFDTAVSTKYLEQTLNLIQAILNISSGISLLKSPKEKDLPEAVE